MLNVILGLRSRVSLVITVGHRIGVCLTSLQVSWWHWRMSWRVQVPVSVSAQASAAPLSSVISLPLLFVFAVIEKVSYSLLTSDFTSPHLTFLPYIPQPFKHHSHWAQSQSQVLISPWWQPNCRTASGIKLLNKLPIRLRGSHRHSRCISAYQAHTILASSKNAVLAMRLQSSMARSNRWRRKSCRTLFPFLSLTLHQGHGPDRRQRIHSTWVCRIRDEVVL